MRAGKTCTGVTLSQDFGQDLVTIATNRSEQGCLCNYKKDPCILFMEFLSQNKKDLYPVYVLSISDHKGTTSYTGRRCKEALKPDLFLTHASYHPQQSNPKQHPP